MIDFSTSESEWIADQRIRVEEYLRTERIDHLGVGECPAFYGHPYIALWAVQSKQSPGSIGWWVISGDLPTDYIGSNDGRHPRQALRTFAKQWLKASEAMSHGETLPGYSIGLPSQRAELAGLLRGRAQIVQKFAEDDALWEGE
jgi:hypothetical protein